MPLSKGIYIVNDIFNRSRFINDKKILIVTKKSLLTSMHNKRLSSNTVRNILLRKNIGIYAAVRKLMLTVRDRLTRLRWCKERIWWSLEK